MPRRRVNAAALVFALLVLATVAAFAWAQRLKRDPLVLDRVTFGTPHSRSFTPNGDCVFDVERIRLRVEGDPARPRLAVFRSLKHIYAQVIDATGGKVLATASTLEKDLRAAHPKGGGREAAAAVGRRIAEKAKAAGFLCGYVSNGNATREVLEYIRPYADAYKIDLKTMNDKNYRKLGAVLNNVLDGIRMVHEMGFWLEIVTLVIPGFNDSTDELFEAARFIRSVSPDIPWHVTAFHQDYHMTEPDNTSAKTLIRAAEIGSEAGMN